MSVEIIGTMASIIVLISFLMKGEGKIRAVNIVGALMLVLYGYLIHSFSTCFLNAMLVIIHTVKLLKMRGCRNGKNRT